MKRHLREARQISLCAVVTGLCVLGTAWNASAANGGKGKVSIPLNQGSTFLTNIISGGTSTRLVDRTSWLGMLRFGQSGIFGSQYISSLPVVSQPVVTTAPSTGSISVGSVNFASLGAVKAGTGTLQFAGTSNFTGSVSPAPQVVGGSLSGGTLTISQPPVSGPTPENSELFTGSAPVVSAPVIQPSSQEAAATPPTPSRRPKPPTPPGPSVVSR